jgi:hypothetical protein
VAAGARDIFLAYYLRRPIRRIKFFDDLFIHFTVIFAWTVHENDQKTSAASEYLQLVGNSRDNRT